MAPPCLDQHSGLDEAAGAAIAINRYDDFGIPQSGNTGRFQYTGQKWLPNIGLYDYKARMYSPTLGRFMQADPIGYADGLNWYNYVGSDPVNKMDSAGTCQNTACDDIFVCGVRGSGLGSSWGPGNYGSSVIFDQYQSGGNYLSGTISFSDPIFVVAKFRSTGAQLNPGAIAAAVSSSPQKVTPADVADASREMREACGANQRSDACAAAKRAHQSAYRNQNQQNPLPKATGPQPLSPFNRAINYIVDSVGCAMGAFGGVGSGGVLGGIGLTLTAESCINMANNGMGRQDG